MPLPKRIHGAGYWNISTNIYLGLLTVIYVIHLANSSDSPMQYTDIFYGFINDNFEMTKKR